ncbi:hypothetical protein N7470_005864 [Penicillium chermesinum]|nr:hypothetical protein N7470_005864 [Penicillium chermesinum]
MPSNRVQQLPYADSQFWAGQELGWAVIVRVEGQAYSLMGVSDLNSSDILPAEVRRAEFTATHSLFDLKAGGIAIRLDFFSPVSPSNYLRQSLPFSYLTVTVTECWGEEVQIYSDIDGRWTGRGNEIMHEFEEYDGLVFHELSVQDAVTYAEEDDMALWDCAKSIRRGGRFIGPSVQLVRGGVVALAHDFGYVIGRASVTFAVGYERKEAINYLGDAYTGYYRARYPTTHEALSFFLDDYGEALSESVDFDNEMTSFSTAAAGQKYADILALSTRQAYGGIDLTIPGDSLDTDNVLAFIKELSSDGNANTIDVIMPAFPYLAADRWTLPYAIHDIGSHYPNATGHDDQKAEPMPIEESGNLLILALAYVQATGDRHWATEYLHIFQKYADYLVENGIDIANQLSSNDAAGPLPNETNLAIKAAIEYPDLPSTWKIPYNIFPDLLLGLGTFPAAAHKMSNDFFSSVRGEYGVPLDHRQDWAKSDWNMWLAATFDPATRDEFIDDLWAFMTNGKHTWPFSDRYVASSAYGNEPGIPILCRARPTVGGHFALLALKGPASFQAFSSNVSQSDQTLRSKGVEL